MSEPIRVLLVDDDERLLQAASRVLRKRVTLVTACGGEEGLAVLKEDGPFAVLVSDQNMPGMSGAEFLAKAAEGWPNTVRVMLTGNDDQSTAAQAVNAGQVFRFLTKPSSPDEIWQAIQTAARQHELITAEAELLERTLSGSVKVLMDVLALSHPEAMAKAQRVRGWTQKLKPALAWPKWWEIDLAAMLWPLGDITLPDELRAKRDRREALSDEEARALVRAPHAAADCVTNIPRLSGVADIIRHSRVGYDGSGALEPNGPAGKDLPQGARLLNVLIALAEETTLGADMSAAVEALGAQPHRYDPVALTALEHLMNEGALTHRRTTKSIEPRRLVDGDIVLKDIRAQDGKLLLAAGSALSTPMIEKIRMVARTGGLVGTVDVMRIELAA